MTKPSNYLNHPFGSVSQKSECETIARNIMYILSKAGDEFRELSFEEYSEHRLKDKATQRDLDLELYYFNQIVRYCVSENNANRFCGNWYKL